MAPGTRTVDVQLRGRELHPRPCPRIFARLLAPALLFKAIVGPLRVSPVVQAAPVLPALGAIWLSFFVGLEWVAPPRVEGAPGGVRFIPRSSPRTLPETPSDPGGQRRDSIPTTSK